MYDECREALRILLEDSEDDNVEVTVDSILAMLSVQSLDILRHLDPPTGLQRWLDSHGLSLVPTRQPPRPRVWDDEDEDEITDAEVVEERPVVNVGDRVRYVTASQGPRRQSQVGSGTVVAIRQVDHEIVVTVRTSPTNLIHLTPTAGDLVEVIGPF